MDLEEYIEIFGNGKVSRYNPAEGLVLRAEYHWIPSVVRFHSDGTVKIMSNVHGLAKTQENEPMYTALEEVCMS